MASTYEPIATTTLSSNQASVSFSSISNSYTDLVLVANGALSAAYDSIELRLNGDTGTNYSRTFLSGNGTSASSGNSTNTSSLALGLMGTENSTDIFHINNYSNTSTYKTVISRANTASNTVRAGVGTWRSTSAINQVTVIATSGNFISGSTFTLYGIKAA